YIFIVNPLPTTSLYTLSLHDALPISIGIDAVAMCVNDIACAGGEPLFFLDYIACGKNYPEKIAQIVKGVAEGCLQSGAALIGGEDRKSTRLNSSHVSISYAVFCLKKK